MAGWSTTRTADQEVHEVVEATKPGGTAMIFVAPGAADAPGAFLVYAGALIVGARLGARPVSTELRFENRSYSSRPEKMV